jgi:uncharacterized protein DUF4013
MSSQPVGGGGTLDFGRAFQFVFEDPDWVKKILIGGLFQLLASVLIGIPFVIGYFLRVVRRTAAGEPRPLPDWDDLGGFFSEGLRGMGLYIVLVGGALLIPGALGCMLGVMGGALSSASREGSDAGSALVGMGIVLFYCLFLLVALVMSIYLPAAMARMTIHDRFGAGLEFGENLNFIRRNLINYLLTLAIYLATSFIAQFGIILFCIGVFPASFWSLCASGWALGETVRRDPQSGPAAPLAPTY